MKDIGKIQHTMMILDKFNLQAKKKFGQNFLVDLNIISNIVECAHIKENTCVIEIGPGIGGLTEYIARQAKKVIAYDIDERLMEVLAYSLEEYEHVEVRLQDFLTVDLDQLFHELKEYDHISIISNLPYYITSELLTKVILSGLNIDYFVGMMQKEVALKLIGKENLPLKLIMDYVGLVKYEFVVSANVFIPKPHVDSAVISMRFKPEIDLDIKSFYELIQGCFKQKRKTIYNNLISKYEDKAKITEVLSEANIDPKTRAEQLSLDHFIKLYTTLNK